MDKQANKKAPEGARLKKLYETSSVEQANKYIEMGFRLRFLGMADNKIVYVFADYLPRT